MDLIQRKLTKSEWNSIEVPISVGELRIIELIKSGFHNVNIKKNYTLSLLEYMKITNSVAIDNYVYVHYLQDGLLDIIKKYILLGGEKGTGEKGIGEKITLQKNAMKKADIIRISNTEKQLEGYKNVIFEYIILELLESLYRQKELQTQPEKEGKREIKNKKKNKNNDKRSWIFYYYTIKTIIKYHVVNVNNYFKNIINRLINSLDEQVNLTSIISQSFEFIEKNEYLLKYADEELYEHQKKLFTLSKHLTPKLILYIAPTGTGKTLSPLGLAETHKIVFVCAARHVGLALAKSAISANKRIAIAFGCNDTEDIRLHYSAAKEYTKNKKSGAIEKVDNTVGDKVEIIICDIKSYIPAMNYMLAFNKKEEIIWYWDEPTITMDYETHEFHKIIQKNWAHNLIPNIVLSSATLPQLNELSDTISDFKSRFMNSDVYEIISHDCKKSIPIINREGFIEMPHYMSDDYIKIKEVVAHCLKHKTLLRYIDLSEIIKFIMYINENDNDIYIKHPRYKLENNITNFEMVNMANLKLYYLELLGNLNQVCWSTIYDYMVKSRTQKMKSNIHIVTNDAHTLTDGPTIFLAEDVEKIALFYIQNAGIPEKVLKNIMETIEYNSKNNDKISILQKNLEDGTKKDEHKEKKMIDGRVDPQMKTLMNKIENLQTNIKSAMLPSCFVPNTLDHINKYGKDYIENAHSRPYTSNISEHNVEQIMLIDDINDTWKLLLLMGIGVFASHKSDRYTEIMKTLAQEQKLYLIIASTDYIYGTNYQFCHGYISKDLGLMSQEKCIQALGRVGRNKLQQDYSIRFRENDLILKLFQNEENKPEIKNMNLLFNTY